MKKVYIIIVNWNGWQDTIECLESVLKLEYDNFRIVVCDNGSVDDSYEKLCSWAEHNYGASGSWQELSKSDAENGGSENDAAFTLVVNGSNLGFGAGSNIGLRYAMAIGDADYCWLLNNDTVVDSMSLKAMVERFAERADAGMCGSTLRDYLNPDHIQALGGASYYKWLGIAWHIGRTIRGDVSIDPEWVEDRMDYVIGCSLLVRASLLKDVGFVSEDYFLYFEEVDWAFRAKGLYSLAYAPKSVVYHKNGASIGTSTDPRKKSLKCDFYTLRNRLMFTRKYYSRAIISVYLGILLELLIRILVGRWDLAGMICHLLVNPGTMINDRSSFGDAVP